MAYGFYAEYAGPHGPHLNFLTMFTKTRDDSKRGGDSIHPRVRNGRTLFAKVNTHSAPKAATKARLIAALSAHCERHPDDAQSNGRLAKLTPA